LVSSAAGQDFICAYDLHGRLEIKRLWAPPVRAHGLFTPPHPLSVLLLNARAIGCYPVLLTTEVTGSLLYRLPGFHSQIIGLEGWQVRTGREAGGEPFPGEIAARLYNPRFDRKLDIWDRHARRIIQMMESIPGWNFVAAPHVKLRRAPAIGSLTILLDRESVG
jgi:hypothetical protein